MKIGILTYHFCYNFGANLQALSTLCGLRKFGHEAVIINWLPPGLVKRYQREISPRQQEAHENFFSRCYTVTAPCVDSRDVAKVIRDEKIDAVMIGSDAVIQYSPWLTWLRPERKTIFRGFGFKEDNLLSSPYLTDFRRYLDLPIPVAMFSVSAQNMPYQHLLRIERSILRKRFCGSVCSVTVRDTWTQRFFQRVCGMNVQISPDPVFGFGGNTEGMIELPDVRKEFGLSDRYVLLTLPGGGGGGGEWAAKLTALFKSDGFECVSLPTPGREHTCPGGDVHAIKLPLSPLEWYTLLKNSAGYVGFNMHPVVSCIHNAVPFFALDQYSVNDHLLFGRSFDLQSSKTFDLLNRCGFLDNYHNLRFAKLPSPETVLERIKNFPLGRLDIISRLKQDEYTFFMKRTLEKLAAGA